MKRVKLLKYFQLLQKNYIDMSKIQFTQTIIQYISLSCMIDFIPLNKLFTIYIKLLISHTCTKV